MPTSDANTRPFSQPEPPFKIEVIRTFAITGLPVAGILLFTSVLLSVAFFVYGLNTLHLTIRARRYRRIPSPPLDARPGVAIHLPIYNEFYVVGRLLESCANVAAQYGKDRVRIYVIDDSIDETSSEVDKIASGYSAQGFQFSVIRRGSRHGFKAGALQAALEATREKYVAVLDADFVPPADFLDKTIPILEHDPSVGFVQTRWGHLDRNYNVVTESVAIGVDAHFFLEQRGRNGSGYLMNFNGSAGVLRAEAIREAGGWNSDTLAEDLDLSYRMQLLGYRGVYMNDLEVPGELPPTIASLKRQQGRWARGSLQTARKLLSRIQTSKGLTLGQKFQAAVHLTYYLVHPLMVASFLLAVAADFLSIDVIRYAVNFSLPSLSSGRTSADSVALSFQIVPWVVFSALVLLSTFAVLLYCIEAVRVQKLGLVENVKQIIMLVVIGYGVSISNSVHALGGLLSSQTGTFSRTPKYAIEREGETWKGKKYQISTNKTTLLEAGGVALAAIASAWAVETGNLGILPILLVYLTGYSTVLYLTLSQTLGSAGSKDS
jgi:cellulose synthase/poly-beta-1,6-N-acetylglucosamine synthase-like glycosyltransferase